MLIATSCSSGGRNERLELKNYFTTGAYDKGLEFINKSDFFKDEKVHLLTLLEKSMFLHAKGEYEASNQSLEEASSLAASLYTIAISKKIEKGLLNDTYDIFYGEIYERSMIYFYSSLNSILLYQKNNNRDQLFKARAQILAWDSYLNSIREDRVGKTIYKNDLVLKIYGAKIHEIVGTPEDMQIALHLYKDAEEVLFKNYNTYLSFNLKSHDFKSDYEKLATMDIKEVKKKYIDDSDLQKSLKEYIGQNIERMTKKISSNKERMTVLLENGIIADKVADKTQFGLSELSKSPAINVFVAQVLGLVPGPGSNNFGGTVTGIATANAALNLFQIGFELPKIANSIRPSKLILNVKDKDKKIILKKDIPLINPMGDIAEEAVQEEASAVYARVGARLATKHIAAIMASFATYKALGGGKKEENFLAKNAAVLQYAAASRAIEESEKADTRYWSTLPSEIRMVDLELEPGEYELELEKSVTEKFYLNKISVTKNNKDKIINLKK